MKKMFLVLLLVGIGLFHVEASFAEVIIIGNADFPLTALSKGDVKKLYLGKTTVISGKVVKLSDCEKKQEEFLKRFIGKSQKAYRKRWIKKVFAEGTTPPTIYKTTKEVVDFVGSTKNAIGYVSEVPSGGNVKVLLK